MLNREISTDYKPTNINSRNKSDIYIFEYDNLKQI